MRNCKNCGYLCKTPKNTYYCNDLDCEIDDLYYPICSDENYYA